MKLAVCPGSFDPVTNGHLDIIRRAAALADRVIVVVMTNASKHTMFTMEERVAMLRTATVDLPNVEIDAYDGLLADYARRVGADAIVKGLRAVTDFEYEFQMALTNRQLHADAETVFLTTSADLMYLSSSVVKQVAMYGGDISGFVPASVLDAVLQKTKG
ncbi:MAG: pantetheine-phosphate adenylyltransferase [Clostridia bacterium]|nr:pantetheine-phosphate adenylyltransferase [Clostridia bacterium]